MASSRTTVAGHDTAFADGRPGEAPAVPTDLDRER